MLIVAGTGRKAGKTTIACRIIGDFIAKGLMAIKISSHFHDPQEHLNLIYREKDYTIWEEMSSTSGKDSSRFLAAGALRSFYIQAEKGASAPAFFRLLEIIPDNSPIVCESPSLAREVIPGVLIVISGGSSPDIETESGRVKDLSYLEGRNALRLSTIDVDTNVPLPLKLDKNGFSHHLII